ncbi:hypothetical protein ACFX19_045860 [Malus domestica]
MSLARQGNHSSLGHRVDVSAIDVNDVPLNKYLHEVTCEQNMISLQPPGAKVQRKPTRKIALARSCVTLQW